MVILLMMIEKIQVKIKNFLRGLILRIFCIYIGGYFVYILRNILRKLKYYAYIRVYNLIGNVFSICIVKKFIFGLSFWRRHTYRITLNFVFCIFFYYFFCVWLCAYIDFIFSTDILINLIKIFNIFKNKNYNKNLKLKEKEHFVKSL